MPIKGILLDIEGTTTPISFVYDVLFPFARRHAAEFVKNANLNELQHEHENDIRQGTNPPPWSAGPLAYIHWLMDRDRKSTPLKAIQGRIWREGYLAGELLGQVFDDVGPAFERWRRQNKLICIYSSGSALAQKLLFGHTTAGDLTNYISRYFDTTIGHKVEADSYRRIADELQLAPAEIVFISDAITELDAARAAGMKTILALRPGNHPVESPVTHPAVTSFSSL